MIIFLFLFFRTKSLNHSFSLDHKEVTFTGTELLTQKYYRESGNYWTYSLVVLKDGISGIEGFCFDGSSSLIQIIIPISCTFLGSSCFRSCSSLKCLSIPEGVSEILENTFADCHSLLNITFSSTITNIKSGYTFASCNSLEKFIVNSNPNLSTACKGRILIHNGQTAIAIAGKYSKYTIPNNVETIFSYFCLFLANIKIIHFESNSSLTLIMNNAFQSSGLQEIILPDSLISIKGSPFMSTKVSSLNLPKNLSNITDQIFDGMNKLISVSVADGCKAVFVDEDKTIFNKNRTTILFLPMTATSFHIPLSVLEVNLGLIRRTNIINISVENNHSKYFESGNILYTADKKKLLANCGGNKIANLISECEEFSENSFQNTLISKINFNGTNFKYVREGSLTNITMRSLEFPEGLEELIRWSITRSNIDRMVFPKTLTTVGSCALYGTLVQRLDFSACSNVNFVERVFEECDRLSEIILPENQTIICKNMFYGCNALKTITIPSTVKEIRDTAFAYSSIQNLIFNGNNLEKLGVKSFISCGLEKITLPSSLKEIGAECFAKCKNLFQLEFPPDSKLEIIGSGIIKGSDLIEEIYLGEKVTSIPAGALNEAYGLTKIKVSENNKVIYGLDGVIYSKDSKLIFCSGGKTSIKIQGGITSINNLAFFKCKLLEVVDFGTNSTISNIGASTFFGCEKIESIILPKYLQSIGNEAFKKCTSLKKITFPSGCTISTLGDSAFEGCDNLGEIKFSSKVASLGDYCFADCTKLKKIVLPSQISKVGTLCFQNDIELSIVEFCSTRIPEGFSDTAFVGCKDLIWIYVSVNFEDEKKNIGSVLALEYLDKNCNQPTVPFTLGSSQPGLELFFFVPLILSPASDFDKEATTISLFRDIKDMGERENKHLSSLRCNPKSALRE